MFIMLTQSVYRPIQRHKGSKHDMKRAILIYRIKKAERLMKFYYDLENQNNGYEPHANSRLWKPLRELYWKYRNEWNRLTIKLIKHDKH